jgi:hypothetical protein
MFAGTLLRHVYVLKLLRGVHQNRLNHIRLQRRVRLQHERLRRALRERPLVPLSVICARVSWC